MCFANPFFLLIKHVVKNICDSAVENFAQDVCVCVCVCVYSLGCVSSFFSLKTLQQKDKEGYSFDDLSMCKTKGGLVSPNESTELVH